MNKKSALVVTGIVLSTLAFGALPASAENALPTPTPSMGAPAIGQHNAKILREFEIKTGSQALTATSKKTNQ